MPSLVQRRFYPRFFLPRYFTENLQMWPAEPSPGWRQSESETSTADDPSTCVAFRDGCEAVIPIDYTACDRIVSVTTWAITDKDASATYRVVYAPDLPVGPRPSKRVTIMSTTDMHRPARNSTGNGWAPVTMSAAAPVPLYNGGTAFIAIAASPGYAIGPIAIMFDHPSGGC